MEINKILHKYHNLDKKDIYYPLVYSDLEKNYKKESLSKPVIIDEVYRTILSILIFKGINNDKIINLIRNFDIDVIPSIEVVIKELKSKTDNKKINSVLRQRVINVLIKTFRIVKTLTCYERLSDSNIELLYELVSEVAVCDTFKSKKMKYTTKLKKEEKFANSFSELMVVLFNQGIVKRNDLIVKCYLEYIVSGISNKSTINEFITVFELFILRKHTPFGSYHFLNDKKDNMYLYKDFLHWYKDFKYKYFELLIQIVIMCLYKNHILMKRTEVDYILSKREDIIFWVENCKEKNVFIDSRLFCHLMKLKKSLPYETNGIYLELFESIVGLINPNNFSKENINELCETIISTNKFKKPSSFKLALNHEKRTYSIFLQQMFILLKKFNKTVTKNEFEEMEKRLTDDELFETYLFQRFTDEREFSMENSLRKFI